MTITAFSRLTAIAAPLPMRNVDTDKIFPGAFLKTVERAGLGKILFHPLRYDAQGQENPQFILNKSPWNRAKILIAGDNFGSGSSREHAVWALKDFGIAAIIAPSFADIFQQNCIKNGILPAVLPEAWVEHLLIDVARSDGLSLTIDLEAQSIMREDGPPINFAIDAAWRAALLDGRDDIALTLQYDEQITRHMFRYSQRFPWIRPINWG